MKSRQLYLYTILICIACFGCKKQKTTECTDDGSLWSGSAYPVGVAVNIDNIGYDQAYTDIAIRQFNSITPENSFKPSYLHPSETVFDWTRGDRLVDFCRQNNQRLHGHTLIWHEQLPQWMRDFEGSRAEWEQLMKTHIQTIVSHYKGSVRGWDVVNEALNEDGTLRNTIWRQKIGDSYIEKAFAYAHEADPSALLLYNDFFLETNTNKRKAALTLLNRLRNNGVQVDGIGLQMHISTLYPEAEQVAQALKEITDNGYKVHLSEIDISMNPTWKEDFEPDQELLNRQANLLAAMILHYNSIPAKYQYGITFWGISDRNSWIKTYYNRKDCPLLYDDNYKPKPAYCKLKEIL